MIFKIPFDSAIFNRQSTLFFDLAWGKTLKAIRTNLITGVLLAVLGIAIKIGKDNIGIIFIVIAVMLFFYTYKLQRQYEENRKRYSNEIVTYIQNRETSNLESTWQLDEEFYRYIDYSKDLKLAWSCFKELRKSADTFFLDSTIGVSFMLTESEVGNEDFEKITAFIEQKLGKKAQIILK